MYEFNPFEFGSYDPDLAHFIELEYVGTNLFNGQPFNSTGCVNGFDNVGRRSASGATDVRASNADASPLNSLAS